jgi:hypothetical protein
MTTAGSSAWATLRDGLQRRHAVAVRYHDHERVVCPHVLGFGHNRPLVLCYQKEGTTSTGALPEDASRRWRCLFVDEIEVARIADGAWESAPNYSPSTTRFTVVEAALPSDLRP